MWLFVNSQPCLAQFMTEMLQRAQCLKCPIRKWRTARGEPGSCVIARRYAAWLPEDQAK